MRSGVDSARRPSSRAQLRSTYCMRPTCGRAPLTEPRPLQAPLPQVWPHDFPLQAGMASWHHLMPPRQVITVSYSQQMGLRALMTCPGASYLPLCVLQYDS